MEYYAAAKKDEGDLSIELIYLEDIIKYQLEDISRWQKLSASGIICYYLFIQGRSIYTQRYILIFFVLFVYL